MPDVQTRFLARLWFINTSVDKAVTHHIYYYMCSLCGCWAWLIEVRFGRHDAWKAVVIKKKTTSPPVSSLRQTLTHIPISVRQPKGSITLSSSFILPSQKRNALRTWKLTLWHFRFIMFFLGSSRLSDLSSFALRNAFGYLYLPFI